MQNILVVEDDIDIQEILNNYLTDAGYKVIIASDGVAGIAKFNSEIDLVLLDIMLPIGRLLRRMVSLYLRKSRRIGLIQMIFFRHIQSGQIRPDFQRHPVRVRQTRSHSKRCRTL